MIQDVLTRFEQYNKEMSPLGDAMDGTKLQAQLQQYKRIRITGNYILPTDIVLYEGMTLLIDQAVVSMAGNIALRGGELHISNSRLVRTSNSHRAGINVHQCGSRVLIENSVIDCAYYGMFLRAEDGVVSVADRHDRAYNQRSCNSFLGRAHPCDSLSFSRLLFCRIRWSINASRRAGCGL